MYFESTFIPTQNFWVFLPQVPLKSVQKFFAPKKFQEAFCAYHPKSSSFNMYVSGDDIYTLDIWGTFFITNLVFWSIGSIYCYFDLTTTPKFLRKYKIQPDTNEPVDPKKFKNLIWTVFLNQTVVYIPLRLLEFILVFQRFWT